MSESEANTIRIEGARQVGALYRRDPSKPTSMLHAWADAKPRFDDAYGTSHVTGAVYRAFAQGWMAAGSAGSTSCC